MNIGFSREIDVRYEVDVCVVGGGPSGMAAAITAARQGKSVYLAETLGFFGGAATAALVPAFMPFDNGVDFLAGGIGREVYDACLEEGFVLSGHTLGIHPEKYKRICDRMITAEKIEFSFFTTLIGMECEADENGNTTANYAVFSAKSGIFACRAKFFIDATGDGDLSVMCGAQFDFGDENGRVMPSTLCSLWNDVDYEKEGIDQKSKLEKAFEDKVFTQEDRHLPGMWKIGDRLGGGNIGHVFGTDSTDERSLSEAMLLCRKIIPEYEKYYREYLGGRYESSSVAITGGNLGVRESRRIIGEYILDMNDYLSRASFPDEIGRFSYPIDIHIAQPNKEAYEAFLKEHEGFRYKKGESYGIPFRILLPKGLVNVLVAGRCVSTDKQMQSSIRVMPACFIMGQAAGIGAAVAQDCKCELRKIDISLLQKKLREIGAFLP